MAQTQKSALTGELDLTSTDTRPFFWRMATTSLLGTDVLVSDLIGQSFHQLRVPADDFKIHLVASGPDCG
jgi:hypothetical protein